MEKVYAFISYNRRVIIPPVKSDIQFKYQPSFKLNYRVAYLIFTWFFTGLILTHYAPLLFEIITPGWKYREYLICGGQIFSQGLIVLSFAKAKVWTYLGNLMTISFCGSILLLIPLALNKWLNIGSAFFEIYFMMVAGLMFLEHIRRTKILQLGYMPTITWVMYRLILLLLILR